MKRLCKRRDRNWSKLQNGDNENSLWQKIRDLSLGSFEKVYELLDVNFDYAHGESFYRDQVERYIPHCSNIRSVPKIREHWSFFTLSISDLPNNLSSSANPMEPVTMRPLILQPLLIEQRNGSRAHYLCNGRPPKRSF